MPYYYYPYMFLFHGWQPALWCWTESGWNQRPYTICWQIGWLMLKRVLSWQNKWNCNSKTLTVLDRSRNVFFYWNNACSLQMANNLLQQAQQLKIMIEHTKIQSLANKEAALQNLRMQMEKEKQDVCGSIQEFIRSMAILESCSMIISCLCNVGLVSWESENFTIFKLFQIIIFFVSFFCSYEGRIGSAFRSTRVWK